MVHECLPRREIPSSRVRPANVVTLIIAVFLHYLVILWTVPNVRSTERRRRVILPFPAPMARIDVLTEKVI